MNRGLFCGDANNHLAHVWAVGEDVCSCPGYPTVESAPILSDRKLLEQIARDAADTRQDIAAILTKVNEVADQVKPTLDSLLSHPMLKMLLR